MNETVLERLAHLEGKLKEMEEENKSLPLRIADWIHRLWKPPEILVYTSLKETIKSAVLHRSAGYWCFPGSHQVPQERGNSTSPKEG